MTSSGLGLGGFGMGNSALTDIGTNGLYNYSNNGYNFSTSLGRPSNGLGSFGALNYLGNMGGVAGMNQSLQMAQKMMSNYLGAYGGGMTGIVGMYGGIDGMMQTFNTQSNQCLQGMLPLMSGIAAK